MSRRKAASSSTSSLSDQQPLNLSDLDGKWYVVRTTLSLWRNKENPAITYGVEDEHTMSDLVTYGDPKNPSRITGTDYATVGEVNGFVWKGNQCITYCVSSKWNFVGKSQKKDVERNLERQLEGCGKELEAEWMWKKKDRKQWKNGRF